MAPRLAALALSVMLCGRASAQFRDDFEALKTDPDGVAGWAFFAGDGTATMDLRQGGVGYASILVDATTDKRGIWWALIERQVSGRMDVGLLQKPGHELRIEARLRLSHAPRRVNLQVARQGSDDDYANLMEFDIPDAEAWHTISLTTHGFEARPGDALIGHLALMDWGLEKYRVDLDYIKVDIVDPATAGPDRGTPVPYHPPVADPGSFVEEVGVVQDGMIDVENPGVNLNDWSVLEQGRRTNLIGVGGSQYGILRWDLAGFAGRKVARSGLLELTTHSIERKTQDVKDFGIVRVVEILGGDPHWDQRSVTMDSLCRYQPVSQVLNPQMIIDWPITEGQGGKTYFTISQPVLQRLIDGKTLGIALRPLGAIRASFYAMEEEHGLRSARLRFNLEKE